MKQKLLFIKMAWNVLFTQKDKGWIFFKLNEEQQLAFLRNEPVDFTVRYMGVDERAVEKIVKRMEKPNEDIGSNNPE